MANPITELVFIPAPGVGHIMSTIEFAKLLVTRDHHLSVTVLVIHPPRSFGGGSAITTYIESVGKNTIDRISFIELPQDKNPFVSKAFMVGITEFINRHCKYVRKIVADKISQSGPNRIAGFVIDMFCTGMIEVANEFNVHTYVFFVSSANMLGFKLYMQTLCDDKNQDVVELSNSDSIVPIPSFVRPVPTKVFPAEVRTKEDLDIVMDCARKLREVKAVILNTFIELETHAIESLLKDSTFPTTVYPVGPILKLDGSAEKTSGNDIITWLDTQPPSSVVLLCFGSLGSFNEIQVKEIAHGLVRSGHRFIWSLRDYEDPRLVLPEGFLERTAEIGKVTGWVPQVALLAHSALGGFVSHSGWNSLLESFWFGVPSATWPIYADQQINAFEMAVELGLAVEITLDYTKGLFNEKADQMIVKAEEIESGIRRLMEDNEVRRKVKEISKKSRATVEEGGSSYASVGRFIQDIKRNIS